MRAIWRVGLWASFLGASFVAGPLSADEPAAPARPRVTTRVGVLDYDLCSRTRPSSARGSTSLPLPQHSPATEQKPAAE